VDAFEKDEYAFGKLQGLVQAVGVQVVVQWKVVEAQGNEGVQQTV